MNKIDLLNVNVPKNFQMTPVQTFRGNNINTQTTSNNQKDLLVTKPDTFEHSANSENNTSKKGLSKAQKIGLGILGTIGTLATIGICFAKHQQGKLTKLYNEKMQLVNLPEKLDFKAATTLEEGIKYAKEILKIQDVDKNFTLDAINYANKSIVDVSNANKGKLFVPKKMWFSKMEDNTLACVIQNIESPHFGDLCINKQFFDDKIINDLLIKRMKKMGLADNNLSQNVSNISKEVSQEVSKTKGEGMVLADYDNAVRELINKFKNDPKTLNITEKRNLMESLGNAQNIADTMFAYSPLSTLKNNLEHFKQIGFNMSIEEFSKLSTEKQSEKLRELIKNSDIDFVIEAPFVTAESTIYHEMGHLQDFAKNLKELDIKHWKIFPNFKEIWNSSKNGKKYVDDTNVRHVDNRWKGITYKGYQELFDKDPKKFKKYYPDLYEFLTNQETQQTAGKVSWYAQTSIGEFIAETYAKMVRGDKIPDDVMKLYEKYNGPKLCA